MLCTIHACVWTCECSVDVHLTFFISLLRLTLLKDNFALWRSLSLFDLVHNTMRRSEGILLYLPKSIQFHDLVWCLGNVSLHFVDWNFTCATFCISYFGIAHVVFCLGWLYALRGKNYMTLKGTKPLLPWTCFMAWSIRMIEWNIWPLRIYLSSYVCLVDRIVNLWLYTS